MLRSTSVCAAWPEGISEGHPGLSEFLFSHPPTSEVVLGLLDLVDWEHVSRQQSAASLKEREGLCVSSCFASLCGCHFGGDGRARGAFWVVVLFVSVSAKQGIPLCWFTFLLWWEPVQSPPHLWTYHARDMFLVQGSTCRFLWGFEDAQFNDQKQQKKHIFDWKPNLNFSKTQQKYQ